MNFKIPESTLYRTQKHDVIYGSPLTDPLAGFPMGDGDIGSLVWFEEDGWQYVMYSGGCYENDTYHIGYAAAKSNERDLTRVDFVKADDHGKFAPVLIKNEVEEGTGHHSVIRYQGEYYAVYHGRDLKADEHTGYVEERTARICRLKVADGKITAERL